MEDDLRGFVIMIFFHGGLDLCHLFHAQNHGLLAINIFAGLDALDERILMHVVWRADIDDVDVGVIDDPIFIGRIVFKAKLLLKRFALFFVAGGNSAELHQKWEVIVIKLHGLITKRVRLAHKAKAEDANFILFFHNLLSSYYFLSLLMVTASNAMEDGA